MAQYDYDMVVIGAGAGGLTASTFAGQSGAKTLLIEKEKKLGGDCLHYGCVPSKSLIKSAKVYDLFRRSAEFGLPEVGRPPVDFRAVRDRIQSIINTIQKHDDPDYLKEHYFVETAFGQPRFLDDRTLELNGKKITSRYFVVATGSSPFVPPIEGVRDVPYLTNMTIFSLESLPKDLIVVGGGPIGLEMAQAMSRLGSQVTVIETTACILPREDLDMSCYVHELLEKEGLRILTEARAQKVWQDAGRIHVQIDQKGQESVVEGQAILMATGRAANVEGLDLEKAGVDFDRRGIRVNAKMQTSRPHIYAVGDVAGGYQFTHVASYEAVVAVTNAVLKIPKKAEYRFTPWCTYLDPEVASIGYNEQRAREAGIRYRVHCEETLRNDRALAESEPHGRLKILLDKKDRVIGVQIIAAHAGDLIAEWIPVVNARMKLSVIADAIHPYPTLSEINKTASVNDIVSRIPAWTKKLMRWLYGYQGRVS